MTVWPWVMNSRCTTLLRLKKITSMLLTRYTTFRLANWTVPLKTAIWSLGHSWEPQALVTTDYPWHEAWVWEGCLLFAQVWSPWWSQKGTMGFPGSALNIRKLAVLHKEITLKEKATKLHLNHVWIKKKFLASHLFVFCLVEFNNFHPSGLLYQ